MVRTQQWGQAGDIPVPGQYDIWIGDDFTVFRPGTGEWLTKGSSQFGTQTSITWGVAGDIPSGAHFNCYTSAPAIFRPSVGTWWIRGISTPHFGATKDIPVAADYSGDFNAEVAVWRPKNGTWYVLDNTDACIN